MENFGGGWTRTNGDRSRGIYSPLQLPLCDTPCKKICWRKDLNPQPSDYKSGALPIELHQRKISNGIPNELLYVQALLAKKLRLLGFFLIFLENNLLKYRHGDLFYPFCFTCNLIGASRLCSTTALFHFLSGSTRTRIIST